MKRRAVLSPKPEPTLRTSRPYTEALQTTLLGVAALIAILGATAVYLTRPTRTTSNAMTLDPASRETAVLRCTVAPQFLEQHLELLRPSTPN